MWQIIPGSGVNLLQTFGLKKKKEKKKIGLLDFKPCDLWCFFKYGGKNEGKITILNMWTYRKYNLLKKLSH